MLDSLRALNAQIETSLKTQTQCGNWINEFGPTASLNDIAKKLSDVKAQVSVHTLFGLELTVHEYHFTKVVIKSIFGIPVSSLRIRFG